MTPLEIGLVSSVYTLGGLFGALASGSLSAKYGRREPMRVAAIISIVGGLLTAVAPSIAVMSLGRFISGLAAGSATVVVPLYISEIAPPAKRGMFGAMTQIGTCTGITVTQVLGFFLSKGQKWRIILAFAAAVGATQLVALTFVSESPKWLGEHGRAREARSQLQLIRGEEHDITSETSAWEDAETEDPEEQGLLTQTTTASSAGAAGKPLSTSTQPPSKGIMAVLLDHETRPATLSVIAVMTAQQLTGINSIVMYGVTLLASLLASSSALLNIFVSVLNMLVTISCSPLPDRFGRKTMILVSIAGMGTSSVLLGIGIRGGIPVLSAIATLLFVASFSTGLGPVPFILSSELVDADAVGSVQSWALASNWIATFVVAQFFPVVNEALGKGMTYFVFAAFGAVFFVGIARYVPETRGKTADEAWGRVGEREE